jgi:hypothetical protein
MRTGRFLLAVHIVAVWIWNISTDFAPKNFAGNGEYGSADWEKQTFSDLLPGKAQAGSRRRVS